MSKSIVNGKKIEKTRKIVVKSFKEVGFKIEVKGNFRRVNFLDVTLNLTNNIYKSYKKPIKRQSTLLQATPSYETATMKERKKD